MTIGLQAYLQGYMHDKTAAQLGDSGWRPGFKGDPGFTDPEGFRGLEPWSEHRNKPGFKGDPGFTAPEGFRGLEPWSEHRDKPGFRGDPGFTMPSEEKPSIVGKISSLYKDILRKALGRTKRYRQRKTYRWGEDHLQGAPPGKLQTPGELR